MGAHDEMAKFQVTELFHKWDNGSKKIRKQILQDFIKNYKNKTGPELETVFAHASSLFLARITTYLRITYMIGTNVREQLQVLKIYLSASCGHKYLAEFLEVGGVLTLLEILGLRQSKEHDKADAITLLSCVAGAGRRYKELICESYGIRAIAECLAKSESDQTQECAKNLLQSLGEGNPKFTQQVYKGLIALLPCSSPKAQQIAAQSIRLVQPLLTEASYMIIDPLLDLLAVFHFEVQYEVIELIRDMMFYPQVHHYLVEGIVLLLKPARDDRLIPLDDDEKEKEAKQSIMPLPIHIQQASAAKCVGVLIRDSEEILKEMVKLGVVTNLVHAMGNSDHADSQRQAALTLEYYCQNDITVSHYVHDTMGDELYNMFLSEPDTLYTRMNQQQVECLRYNMINMDVPTKRDRKSANKK